MQNPKVKSWFSKHWKVLNERSILSWNKNGEIAPIRPDRVITDGNQIILIDYKTGQENNSYKSQVKKYINHLHLAGKTNLKAFIWYISLDKIIEVPL